MAEGPITQCERFGIDKAETIDMVVARPVAEGIHNQSPHRGMPTVQHPLGPVNQAVGLAVKRVHALSFAGRAQAWTTEGVASRSSQDYTFLASRLWLCLTPA
jgi:hypothetical protein